MALQSTRPPSYPSRATLAHELDVSESTVDEMVRRGVLPKPLRLSNGCIRWCWQDVQAALVTLKVGAETSVSDPFLAGANNVTKTSEGRRGAA
jgi:predicted DNA-binding transcriptional regulator AlpA